MATELANALFECKYKVVYKINQIFCEKNFSEVHFFEEVGARFGAGGRDASVYISPKPLTKTRCNSKFKSKIDNDNRCFAEKFVSLIWLKAPNECAERPSAERVVATTACCECLTT